MARDYLTHTVTVLVERKFAGDIRVAVAQQARAELHALIASGRAPAQYRRFVDNVEGAPEESVKIPGGIIVYKFSRLHQAIIEAYNSCVSKSPAGSGAKSQNDPRYKASWTILVNGQFWTRAITAIPLDATVAISNTRPYHRKIDIGGQQISVPPQIIERVRQQIGNKYPELYVQRKFLTWPGAYVLQGRQRSSGLSYQNKLGFAYLSRTGKFKVDKKGFQRVLPSQVTDRADSRKGEVMTYPSLILSEA